MAFFDKSLPELKTYLPEREEPRDFDAFWAATLDDARNFVLDPVFTAVDYGLRTVDTYDVTFSGYGGQRNKGGVLLPLALIQH